MDSMVEATAASDEQAVCVDAGVGCGGPLYFFGARWVCRAHSMQRGIY
jgi:hypothetical protein